MEEKYYKDVKKESIEDIMRCSKSLYKNKFGSNLGSKDIKHYSQLEKEYFKYHMHEKLNLDGYVLLEN